ncbi:Autophagy-related protein 2 [Nakaseomyces bracarensis]|uniref:Autophagy-related protein 2 n=1 Tax=Nakaseomyces bracarensis TaxID=273131 RepID=A0ABR4NYC3_9SACH
MAFWLPQNIQRRLLLYVLQQITLFSNVDVSKLDVSLGSHSKFSFRDVDLNVDDIDIPGFDVISGSIGGLRIGLTVSGDVSVNGDGITFVLSIKDNDDLADLNAFSLAKSIHDLTTSMIQFNPQSKLTKNVSFSNESETDRIDDNAKKQFDETGGVGSYYDDYDDLENDDAVSSTTESEDNTTDSNAPTSRLNGMQQKVIAIALAKLKIVLQNLTVMIKIGDDIDSNYFLATIKKIDMSTMEKNERIFDIHDLQVFYCTSGSEDSETFTTDMSESMYFSQIDTKSVYMSAIEDAGDIKNSNVVNGLLKQELVKIGNLNFNMNGLSSLDDLSISSVDIHIDCFDISLPVLFEIKDDVIFKLVRSWMKKTDSTKLDVKNSPAYKRFQREVASPNGQVRSEVNVVTTRIKLNSTTSLICKGLVSNIEEKTYNFSVKTVDLQGIDSNWNVKKDNFFSLNICENCTTISISDSTLELSILDLSSLILLFHQLQEYQDFIRSKIYGKLPLKKSEDTKNGAVNIDWGGFQLKLLTGEDNFSLIIPEVFYDHLNSSLHVNRISVTKSGDLISDEDDNCKNHLEMTNISIDLSGHRSKSNFFDENFLSKYIFTNMLVTVSNISIFVTNSCLENINQNIEEITNIISPGVNGGRGSSSYCKSGKKTVKLLTASTVLNNKALLSKFVIKVGKLVLHLLDIPIPSFGELMLSTNDILVSATKDDIIIFNSRELDLLRISESGTREHIIQGITYHDSEKSRLYSSLNPTGKIKVRCTQTIFFYYATWLKLLRGYGNNATPEVQPKKRSSDTIIDLQVTDSILIMQPYRIKPALALTFGVLSVNYRLENNSTNISIRSNKLLLTDLFTNITSIGKSASNPVELLMKTGFSSIGRVEDVTITPKFAPTENNVHIGINSVILSMCADSFHTFIQLCMDLKYPETFPDDLKYEIVPTEKVDVFSTVSDNEFDSSALSKSSNILFDDVSETGSLHIVNSFIDEVDDTEELISHMAPTSSGQETSEASSTKGHIPISLKEEYIDAPRIRNRNPIVNTDKHVVLPLTIEISKIELRFFDGFDWKYTRKHLSKAIDDMEDEGDILANSNESNGKHFEKASLFDSICISTDQKDKSKLKETITEQIQGERQLSLKNKANFHPSKHYKCLILAENIMLNVRIFGSNHQGNELDFRNSDDLVDVEGAIGMFDIVDNIPTSTWNKFVTILKKESWPRKEPMLSFSFILTKPINYLQAVEAIIDLKLAPLRIHADQDMVDFLLRFLQFKDDRFELIDDYPEILFIQKFKTNTVKLRIDYKPKKTKNGLYSGHIMDIMNLFVLDESKLSLKGVILYGINGFTELGEELIKVWGTDVTSKQLFNVLQGFSPIKSFVSIGEGAQAFITVLLAEYKRDKSITRSVKKGGNIFVKTTTGDFIKLSTKLALGTQSLLENTEGMFGGIGPKGRMTSILEESSKLLDMEELFQEDQLLAGNNPKVRNKPPSAVVIDTSQRGEDGRPRVVSLYADQPLDVHQGLEEAYQALEKHLQIAYDTIWKTNKELRGMEGSGAKAAAITIARAAPIAIIRPMIGATEAIAKTLQGLYNQWDKSRVEDINDKYKKPK